jgi:uncharacterized protein YgiM (DUF1202 family)
MKKILLIFVTICIALSATALTSKDKSEYQEISFTDAIKQRNNGTDLNTLYCKTKCHLTLINWDDWTGWYQLVFYSNNDNISLILYKDRYSFDENTKLFSSFSIYYHFEGNMDNGFDSVLDYIEPNNEIRFVGTKYIATDTLRIRTAPSLNSEKIGVLKKGEVITITEIGNETTIDGINSIWAKIKTENGKTGWCFAGYLTDGNEYK